MSLRLRDRIRLTVSIELRLVTDGQTDRQTDTAWPQYIPPQRRAAKTGLISGASTMLQHCDLKILTIKSALQIELSIQSRAF